MGGRHHDRSRRSDARDSRALRRKASLVLVLLVATGVVVSMLVLRAARIAQLHRQIDELERRRDVARSEQQRLEQLLAAARDPAVLEDVARRWLGLVFPGEEKAVFIEEE